ncbi:MAG TPA: 4-(cytidine 5'-diphospho)-2-C-methyl-D-erythritol kinase, partial [Elusimicrobia bacterium]|nr:4-(cytidine 5'-diphospho)-2-C-methyl-D-erythritol kinase [Elusimicrobiota bacterium]
ASGLGGGSSDAGCILNLLNQIWELNLSKDVLFSLAKKIGADVPFFLQGGYAYAQGIGENISSYSFLPNYWLVLVNPGLMLQSKEIYAQYDRLKLTKRTNFNKMKTAKFFWQNLSTAQEIAKNLFNRLEDVVLPGFPEIAKIKEILISFGALGSLMSGSGSTVFGIVESEKKGKEILKKLR